MKKNPKIEICSCVGGEWLRIEAMAVEDENIEIKQKMLDAYPSLKSMYSADDDNTQVLYLKNATATFFAFGKEPRTLKF
jgi:uncharacterized pyridoxamine 5'-phosphate oxidase family protein